MQAAVGDEIVVDAPITGGLPREGEILAIRTNGDVVHYVVRWDDGHETLFYPGSDAHIVRPRARKSA
ncbi:MAG TPA: DUF1918 domain-containing protein [Acidimicrobiia bacterium]|nr:DUF1918 domain-containing protein [Acidimicrobiia bacterium]